MRWLTPIILIVVLLTAACGHDPGGKDKIAVIDWDKAFSAHPKQTVLKQGEAELQKLLRYREEQAEIAKTQIAGLTRLQQLKQNSKANFLDAGFQTQMYAAEAKENLTEVTKYNMRDSACGNVNPVNYQGAFYNSNGQKVNNVEGNIDYFGDPIYMYSLKQGIEDGFLAPFKVINVTLNKTLLLTMLKLVKRKI